jgi:hypothetical protein
MTSRFLVPAVMVWCLSSTCIPGCSPPGDDDDYRPCRFSESPPPWSAYVAVVTAHVLESGTESLVNSTQHGQMYFWHLFSDRRICVQYSGPGAAGCRDDSPIPKESCFIADGALDLFGAVQSFYCAGNPEGDALFLRFEAGESFDAAGWPRALGRSGRLVGYFVSADGREVHEVSYSHFVPREWCSDQPWDPPPL